MGGLNNQDKITDSKNDYTEFDSTKEAPSTFQKMIFERISQKSNNGDATPTSGVKFSEIGSD